MSDDNGNVLTDITPGSIRRIHLVGVAGTGMGSFAGMLKAAGYDVTGSDEQVYPPKRKNVWSMSRSSWRRTCASLIS